LPDGEDVVMRLRPHGRALVVPAAVLVVVMGLSGYGASAAPAGAAQAVLRVGIGAVALLLIARACLVPFLRWRTTTLTITDRRIRARQGVLRSRTREVPLGRIADVVVERSLLQRLTGSGTLLLDTVGERGGLRVPDVPGVVHVARVLNDLIVDLPAVELDDDRERLSG
jgi:uncharacterized membrane protein YdbT with pleckstrin-like domain